MEILSDLVLKILPKIGQGTVLGSITAKYRAIGIARMGCAVLSAAILGLGLLPLTASAQSCVPNTTADWMASRVASDYSAQAIRPTDCAVVLQTPPDFRWPDVISSGGYSVTLTYPDGHTKVLAATQNWLNWNEILPSGTYSWSVGYAGGAASAPRKFIVDGNSKPFLVPNMSTVLSAVIAKPHPRSLPDATTLALMKSQRSSAVNSLLSMVGGSVNQSLPAQGYANDGYTYSYSALAAMMACVYSNVDTYCNDAIRRVVNLASWDPTGSTSFLVNDMPGRYLTWTLATGYDWLYPRLSATQRSQILNSLLIRNGDMYNDIIGSRSRISITPRDSHSNLTLYFVAVISTLLSGDLTQANTWMPNSLPLAINALNPWSDEEGGFANAATQGVWDIGESLPALFQLRYMTGIDVGQKAWVRNFGRYLAYFVPPGTPGGRTVFGDGFELNEAGSQARYGKGYTYLSPTPIGRWHMSMIGGEDQTRIEYLMAPPADFSGPQPLPAGTSNALLLSSIGQVAMHSDLANSARTSVYFKSSPPPYGAFNHSHADQNSFAINAGGQPLAIETGYYDGYKTAHWTNWYHQTKAKNAITFDGGQGQRFLELDYSKPMGYGRVTSFSSTAAADIVTGDALAAYDAGAVGKAQRSLVYLRPNLILVYDNLASATARQWEWNIHAVNQMSVASDTQISIQNGGQTLCVKMLAGPAMRFSQTNAFSTAPSNGGANQWHGMFYTTSRIPATEFVALLNVGCTAVTASATKTNNIWTIPVGDKTISIAANGAVSLSGGTITPPPPTVQAPYTGTPITVPGTVEAENFDKGGEGLAYHDLVPGNQGGQYRLSEDVDIITSTDTLGGGYVVNNFAQGEWLAYTINVATAGRYIVGLRSSQNFVANAAYHLEVDGIPVTGSVLVPNTGDWSAFLWTDAPSIALSAGKHILKVVAETPYFNLNTLRFVTDTSTPPPPASTPFTGTPFTVPGTFEAENFDKGGEGLAYHDTVKGNAGGLYRLTEDVDIIASTDTLGGGYVVNNFATGEWMNYTINVVAGGRYTIGLRAAQNFGNSVAFHVEVDNVPMSASILVPNTTDWSVFQWVDTPAITLTTGKHVLKVVADQQYFNLNSIRVNTAP